MLEQENNAQREEHFGVKIGIILLAIVLIIATFIVVQRSINLSQATTETSVTTLNSSIRINGEQVK